MVPEPQLPEAAAMKNRGQAKVSQISLKVDDGRRAARVLALTMGILFSLIFVLHGLSP